MAFNAAPSSWIASWSENGTNVTFPIASVPELTDAEADGTTGDIRKVVYALLEKLWSDWNALDSGDRPARMVLGKSVSTNAVTGVSTHTFALSFETESTGTEVIAE